MYLTLNIFVVFEIIIVLLKLKNSMIMVMVVVCLFVWDDDANDWKSIAFISQKFTIRQWKKNKNRSEKESHYHLSVMKKTVSSIIIIINGKKVKKKKMII